MADREGIVSMRTTREKTAVLYGADERFPIGGSKVLRRSGADAATVEACARECGGRLVVVEDRPGEVWGAESGTDRLVRVRHGGAPDDDVERPGDRAGRQRN